MTYISPVPSDFRLCDFTVFMTKNGRLCPWSSKLQPEVCHATSDWIGNTFKGVNGLQSESQDHDVPVGCLNVFRGRNCGTLRESRAVQGGLFSKVHDPSCPPLKPFTPPAEPNLTDDVRWYDPILTAYPYESAETALVDASSLQKTFSTRLGCKMTPAPWAGGFQKLLQAIHTVVWLCLLIS